MRDAFIAWCILYNESWDKIEKMTGVKADTARHLMDTFVKRADTRDLNEILTIAAPLPHTGRPPKVVSGTYES